MGNMRFQNVMMLINQMMMVRADADIDPAALVWKPFGIIPVENLQPMWPRWSHPMRFRGERSESKSSSLKKRFPT